MTDTERVARVPRRRSGEHRADQPTAPAAAGGPRGVTADVLPGVRRWWGRARTGGTG